MLEDLTSLSKAVETGREYQGLERRRFGAEVSA